jgi:hypothetical protein
MPHRRRREKAEEGRRRAARDADADRRQEDKECGGEEVSREAAAQIRLAAPEGYSAHVCPVASSTSFTSARASSEETPRGGTWYAIANARSGACGSAWSCIQPCSSHSRMAPASCSTEIAQPRNVRTAGRRSKVISMCVRSCPDESTRPAIRSSCYHKAGIPECRSGPFCPPVRCSVERFSLDSSCATMTSESQGRLRRLTQSNVTQVRVQISVGYNRLWSSRATL